MPKDALVIEEVPPSYICSFLPNGHWPQGNLWLCKMVVAVWGLGLTCIHFSHLTEPSLCPSRLMRIFWEHTDLAAAKFWICSHCFVMSLDLWLESNNMNRYMIKNLCWLQTFQCCLNNNLHTLGDNVNRSTCTVICVSCCHCKCLKYCTILTDLYT